MVNSIAVFIGVRETMAYGSSIERKELPSLNFAVRIRSTSSRVCGDSYDFLRSLSGTQYVDKKGIYFKSPSRAGHSYIYKERDSGEATSSQNIHPN
jgi:hypothetical protein